MTTVEKIKDWIKENAPMFSVIYENKYVGMMYDRFGSLPPKQQKQVILGTFGGLVGILFLYLFISYLSLWSTQGTASQSKEMVTLLRDYEAQMRDKSGQMAKLEQNSSLGNAGQLKTFITEQARSITPVISPKIMEVTEKADAGGGAGGNTQKEATVVLQRVNLAQLKGLMQAIEFGPYNITVTALKIVNDEKLRGYMRAEVTVVAVVPQTDSQAAGAGGG